jgi:glucokinase
MVSGRAGRVVIGVDLGGTNLRVAGVDSEGRVVHLSRDETGASGGPEEVLQRLVGGLTGVDGRLRASGWDVVGASLGVPGVISRKEGVVASSPNLPGWKKIPLLDFIRERVNFPLMMENDANAAAYGEFWVGAAKGCRTAVLMTLGTGVGGGIIAGGRLLRGADGMAGEIGHLTVEREGEPCPCGNRGCLERYASAAGVARRYRRLQEEFSGAPSAGETTAAAVHSLARKGDAVALRTFREAGTCLGIALASVVNIVNPEVLIIGGGLLPAWDFFMPSAREEMFRRAFQAPAERVRLLPALLGDQAGYIGAAGLFWKEWQGA